MSPRRRPRTPGAGSDVWEPEVLFSTPSIELLVIALSPLRFPPVTGLRFVMPTGIALAVPLGWGGFVLPRSGLAARNGVTVVNGPGLVDAGYRGEIMVPLINTDPLVPYAIKRGERIAQLLFLQVPEAVWEICEELPPVPGGADGRGAAGFGSSGR